MVSPSHESFDYWLNQSFLSASARQQLESANLLVTPRIGHPSFEGPLFAEGANEFLEYCKGFEAEGLDAQLCLGEEKYVELSLLSYELFLPDAIVEQVIVPIYVKVMNGYIIEKLTSRLDKSINVTAKVIIEDKKKKTAKEIIYRGSAADYKDTVGSAIEEMIRNPE